MTYEEMIEQRRQQVGFPTSPFADLYKSPASFATGQGANPVASSESSWADYGLIYDPITYKNDKDLANLAENDPTLFSIYQQRQNRAFQQVMALQQQEAAQSSAREAMQFSHDEAALDRQFQQDMSNTAYQRVMADLKKAGLNPVLAYDQGPASSPAGASSSGVSASMAQADVDVDTLAGLLEKVLDVTSAENIANAKNRTSIINTILGRLIPNISLPGRKSG